MRQPCKRPLHRLVEHGLGTKDKVIINTENINFISVEENYVSVGESGIILSVESIKRLIDILKGSEE
jgi:hypothetical protein